MHQHTHGCSFHYVLIMHSGVKILLSAYIMHLYWHPLDGRWDHSLKLWLIWGGWQVKMKINYWFCISANILPNGYCLCKTWHQGTLSHLLPGTGSFGSKGEKPAEQVFLQIYLLRIPDKKNLQSVEEGKGQKSFISPNHQIKDTCSNQNPCQPYQKALN